MKKLMLTALAVISFVCLCKAQDAKAPYKAEYSSNFTIADQSYANKILTIWKDYEENMLDRHLDWFADTVSMSWMNGQTVKGKAANLQGAKEYRGMLKNLKISLDASVSLKSDKGDNVVCVWGTEEYTDKDGKKAVNHLQEVWGFNKDGKIDMMLQYARAGGSM
ncbi:MAG: hypothetical protein JST50_23170 [Bacteroidetes bacterium]|jgi:hypothetical protein|nr:hypothetical protein [Bacteroidota bacterium]